MTCLRPGRGTPLVAVQTRRSVRSGLPRCVEESIRLRSTNQKGGRTNPAPPKTARLSSSLRRRNSRRHNHKSFGFASCPPWAWLNVLVNTRSLWRLPGHG